jgi:hypothetical protein
MIQICEFGKIWKKPPLGWFEIYFLLVLPSCIKKVKLSLCLTNQALRYEGVWGSGHIDPHFLDLGTSWRWVVSFTPLPVYPRGKSPRYPLGPRTGLNDIERRKFLTLPGLQLRSLRRPARSQSLYLLRYPGSTRCYIMFIFFLTRLYAVNCMEFILQSAWVCHMLLPAMIRTRLLPKIGLSLLCQNRDT